MLISLHLAKTAGSSFFTSLKDHYANQILRDYADLPLRGAGVFMGIFSP